MRAIAGAAPCSLSHGQCLGLLTPEAKATLASLDSSRSLAEQFESHCLISCKRIDELATLECAARIERSMGKEGFADRTGHRLTLRLFAVRAAT